MPYHSPRQSELEIIIEEPKKKKITLLQMFPSMKKNKNKNNKNKKTNSVSNKKEMKNKKNKSK